MKTTLTRWMCTGALVVATQAAHAEPSVGSMLGGFAQIAMPTFSSLAFGAGTRLAFTLVGEETRWAGSQTFSVFDGATPHSIFTGSHAVGATTTYSVTSSFTGVSFNSGSGVASQTYPNGSDGGLRVYQLGTSQTYGFAYEDWTRERASVDYNDMVVVMTAAVPEPATYAMMLVGLGMLGFAACRRGSKA